MDYQSEGSGDDVVDSDFDIDENDEVENGYYCWNYCCNFIWILEKSQIIVL
jgi:hypothetical protein